MPWMETCAMEQRCAFVVEWLSGASSFSALCRRYGISRPTGYKWVNRYREADSLAGLQERSRRPLCSPNQTQSAIESRVVELREKYGWGGRKLRILLQREGLDVPKVTIDRIVKRAGLTEQGARQRPASKRFARSEPNQAWQVDFKGQYPIRGGRECFPLSMLDDCTRHCLRLEPHTCQLREPVQSTFVSVFRTCGVPDQMILDRGVPWFAPSSAIGLTRLGVFLIRQGVELIFGRPYHPQTRGKVERFHGTLARWLRRRGLPNTLQGFREALNAFREEYNEIRPHESLDLNTPASRWRPSDRPYRPHPPEWVYPEGAILRKINTAGALRYRSGEYFVSDALIGELVRCQDFDGKVLVSYRNMIVREIDLRTKRTRAVIRTQAPKL